MCWAQLLTSTIQFLCISVLETLLHVAMKTRAEISAENLTILVHIRAIGQLRWN